LPRGLIVEVISRIAPVFFPLYLREIETVGWLGPRSQCIRSGRRENKMGEERKEKKN
jgi:hypothetical protein